MAALSSSLRLYFCFVFCFCLFVCRVLPSFPLSCFTVHPTFFFFTLRCGRVTATAAAFAAAAGEQRVQTFCGRRKVEPVEALRHRHQVNLRQLLRHRTSCLSCRTRTRTRASAPAPAVEVRHGLRRLLLRLLKGGVGRSGRRRRGGGGGSVHWSPRGSGWRGGKHHRLLRRMRWRRLRGEA